MSEGWRLERYRGGWAAVRGHGNAKRRVKIYENDRASAEGVLRRINAEVEARKQPGALTIDKIMAIYIADREKAEIVNLERIKEVRRSIQPVWGDKLPEDLSIDECRAFIARGRRRRLSDATIRQEMAYLQAALNFAAKSKLIAPVASLTKPPPPRARERWLTRPEAEKLVDAALSPHAKLFIVLSIATAARPKHLLELTWDRVDMRRRVIELDNPAKDRTRKGRARVPINDMAYEHLQIAQLVAETDHVIEFDSKPVKSVRTAVEAAARRANLDDVSPYVLRHTAGVWMAQAGVSIEEIAEYMGHTSIETTRKHYARFHPEHLRRASSALEMNPSGALAGSIEPPTVNGERPNGEYASKIIDKNIERS